MGRDSDDDEDFVQEAVEAKEAMSDLALDSPSFFSPLFASLRWPRRGLGKAKGKEGTIGRSGQSAEVQFSPYVRSPKKRVIVLRPWPLPFEITLFFKRHTLVKYKSY